LFVLQWHFAIASIRRKRQWIGNPKQPCLANNFGLEFEAARLMHPLDAPGFCEAIQARDWRASKHKKLVSIINVHVNP